MPVVFGLIHVKMSCRVTKQGQLSFSKRQYYKNESFREMVRKPLTTWRRLKFSGCRSNLVIIVSGIILSVYI